MGKSAGARKLNLKSRENCNQRQLPMVQVKRATTAVVQFAYFPGWKASGGKGHAGEWWMILDCGETVSGEVRN